MMMRILTTHWNREPERGSRPFSKDRSGFVLGEGAWFFILEELEHARARGAKIYGEIVGYASTCEAYHRVRLEECGEEPAHTMTMAMDEAGIGGVAATLLAMRDGVAPPTINLDDPDPECDLDYIPEEARRIDCEYALANCIAFGCKNSALVLRKV
jgi:3-oxoacyl-[acyl-carrier-protein] synthase II